VSSEEEGPRTNRACEHGRDLKWVWSKRALAVDVMADTMLGDPVASRLRTMARRLGDSLVSGDEMCVGGATMLTRPHARWR
jgi:hypothetical protein